VKNTARVVITSPQLNMSRKKQHTGLRDERHFRRAPASQNPYNSAPRYSSQSTSTPRSFQNSPQFTTIARAQQPPQPTSLRIDQRPELFRRLENSRWGVSQKELVGRFEERNLSERFLRALVDILERTDVSWPEAYGLFLARHSERLAHGGKGVEPRWIPSDIAGAIDLNVVSGTGKGSVQPLSPVIPGKWATSRLSITRPPGAETEGTSNQDLPTLEDARKDVGSRARESQSLRQPSSILIREQIVEMQGMTETSSRAQLNSEAPLFTPRTSVIPPYTPVSHIEAISHSSSSQAQSARTDAPHAASSHVASSLADPSLTDPSPLNPTDATFPHISLSPAPSAQHDHSPPSASTAGTAGTASTDNKSLLESIDHIAAALTSSTANSHATALQAAIDQHTTEIARIKLAITDLEVQCEQEEQARMMKEVELRALREGEAQSRKEEKEAIERAIGLLQARLGEFDSSIL